MPIKMPQLGVPASVRHRLSPDLDMPQKMARELIERDVTPNRLADSCGHHAKVVYERLRKPPSRIVVMFSQWAQRLGLQWALVPSDRDERAEFLRHELERITGHSWQQRKHVPQWLIDERRALQDDVRKEEAAQAG